MRILVTGATGFAGRWLIRELEAAGHSAIPAPPSSQLDITDHGAIAELVASARPDAVAHLAGLAYAPDARRDPDRARAVNEDGARSIVAAAAATARPVPVLLVSSADVYGQPVPEDLPLSELAPLRTNQPYGLSKLAGERAAVEAAAAGGVPIVIVRPFNHAGPGQRPEFVVPALANRVLAARDRGATTITAGNVDVLRDFTDVRDVARAYRLILESLDEPKPPLGSRLYNIATGRSVAIRDIALAFASHAGIDIGITIDPNLVRTSDPPEIRGDASLIAADLGWRPTIPLEVTLRDVFEDAVALSNAAPG